MKLVPVTSCRLHIGWAEVELLRGDELRAMELVKEALSIRQAHGRIAQQPGRIAPRPAARSGVEDAP
jgi:hypothetical protein